LTVIVTVNPEQLSTNGCISMAVALQRVISWALDHIHDWAHGGETKPENLEALSPTGRTYDKPPDAKPVDHTRPKITDRDPPPF
jgi:hypothetical protein